MTTSVFGASPSESPRYLITGALGCIGAWTVLNLVRRGVHVVAFDLGSDSRRVRQLATPEEFGAVTFLQGDITKLDSVERALDDHGITHVIHLAALQVPFCRANPPLGALVNVVDRPALCTFTVPAVVRRGDLTLAVATEGRCPSLARTIREQLERQYGPEYAEAVARLADLRQRLMAEGWTSSRIHTAVSALVDAGLVQAIASGDEARAASLLAAPFRDPDGITDGHDR